MAVTKAILEKWMAAQKRHRLSDRHVQMARELGLNPDKLGKIDNHRQEPWKAPLPQFIENIYFKRFKRDQPETVRPLKQILKEMEFKKKLQKEKKEEQRKQRRFSDFAFLILTSCSVFIFSWRVPVFIFSLISIGCQKFFFISLGNPFPM